jgi:hypothetical protein
MLEAQDQTPKPVRSSFHFKQAKTLVRDWDTRFRGKAVFDALWPLAFSKCFF